VLRSASPDSGRERAPLRAGDDDVDTRPNLAFDDRGDIAADAVVDRLAHVEQT
jgi:hypothetical protein